MTARKASPKPPATSADAEGDTAGADTPSTERGTRTRPGHRRQPAPAVTLQKRPSGSYVAHYRTSTFRFLLADGTTVDVLAHRDDSALRFAVLATQPDGARIEGVARLEAP